MLFRRALWEGMADGSVTLAFRRWKRPQVKAGGRQRMAIGVLAFDSVEVVNPVDITDEDAQRAGYDSREGALRDLERYGEGPAYRIAFHFDGPDPRVALRNDDRLSDADWETLTARLARMDKASRHGPWTLAVLRLIAEGPEVRAADLAASMGRERDDFKLDVRKLKELGLTESLEKGYRLSPRGRAVLDRLAQAS